MMLRLHDVCRLGKPKQSVFTKPDEGENQTELELEVKTREKSGNNE